MSSLWMVRHGQAGSRADYDKLSVTGRMQAALLGEACREEGITFDAAFCGTMRRQRETAELVLGRLASAPDLVADERWNEFSLEGLWQFLGERMIASNAEFARQYRELHAADGGPDRTITACDIELIRSWVAGEHEIPEIESWKEFRARIESPLDSLSQYPSGARIAIFTSATPIAIWTARALHLDEQRLFEVAAVLHNSGISSFRLKEGRPALFTLNGTAHLRDDRLRTFR